MVKDKSDEEDQGEVQVAKTHMVITCEQGEHN